MKTILKHNRWKVIMKCDKTNCLCEFETDEYERRFWGFFDENICYRDICPICKNRFVMINLKECLSPTNSTLNE